MYNGINQGPMMEKERIGSLLPGHAGMNFKEKLATRRSMTDQIQFNIERLGMLHKELSELKSMLEPYIINVPVCEKEGIMQMNPENNSEIMDRLLRESTMINELIGYVSDMKRDLQL